MSQVRPQTSNAGQRRRSDGRLSDAQRGHSAIVRGSGGTAASALNQPHDVSVHFAPIGAGTKRGSSAAQTTTRPPSSRPASSLSTPQRSRLRTYPRLTSMLSAVVEETAKRSPRVHSAGLPKVDQLHHNEPQQHSESLQRPATSSMRIPQRSLAVGGQSATFNQSLSLNDASIAHDSTRGDLTGDISGDFNATFSSTGPPSGVLDHMYSTGAIQPQSQEERAAAAQARARAMATVDEAQTMNNLSALAIATQLDGIRTHRRPPPFPFSSVKKSSRPGTSANRRPKSSSSSAGYNKHEIDSFLEHSGSDDETAIIPYSKTQDEDTKIAAAEKRRIIRTERALVNKFENHVRAERRRQQAVLSRGVQQGQVDRTEMAGVMWLEFIAVIKPIAILIQARKENQARQKLQRLFSFRISRFLRIRRERAQRNIWQRGRIASMAKLTAKELRGCTSVLADLPDSALNALLENVTATCFKAGEYIIQEGSTGTEAYILDGGVIAVMAGERSLQSPTMATTISAMGGGRGQVKYREIKERFTCIGEHALLAPETHKYSYKCQTDVDLWTIPSAAFQQEVSKLPSALREHYNVLTDQRRTENIRSVFELKEENVRSASPIFADWSSLGIGRLLLGATPQTFRKGVELYREGQQSTHAYFVMLGRVDLYKKDGVRIDVLRAGQAFGEVGCLMGTKRHDTAKAGQQCDVWMVSRDDILDIAAHEQLGNLLPLLKAMNEKPDHKKQQQQQSLMQQQSTVVVSPVDNK